LETVRDLGRAEPWQESIERSRARRLEPPKRRSGLRRRGASRGSEGFQTREGSRGRAGFQTREGSRGRAGFQRRAGSRRRAGFRKVNFLAVGGVAALALVVPNMLATHQTHPSTIANPAALQQSASSPEAATSRPAALPLHRAARKAPTCTPSRRSRGYVNPLAHARVKAERIDQGVDYDGTGTLTAIGAAKVTEVATEGTGWPGTFVEYRLLHGPDAGCFVYYAEGVEPAAGLRVGETVHAGQAVATLISGWATGIEIGWGSGVKTNTLAMQHGKWNITDDDDNRASSAGKSFSALIVALGGPAGKVEG
jgi:hypothetical protein